VKLSTEDNPQEHDDYLSLLCELWRKDISVNNNSARGELTIIGSTDPDIIEAVSRNYHKAAHWLPGKCDGCTAWCLERVESYWGAHPHFCFKCLAWTVQYFNLHDKWPEGNWFPGETFTIEGIEDMEEDGEA